MVEVAYEKKSRRRVRIRIRGLGSLAWVWDTGDGTGGYKVGEKIHYLLKESTDAWETYLGFLVTQPTDLIEVSTTSLKLNAQYFLMMFFLFHNF